MQRIRLTRRCTKPYSQRNKMFFKFSALKETFFDFHRKTSEVPIFKFPIEALEILKDPLDYYAALIVTSHKKARC